MPGPDNHSTNASTRSVMRAFLEDPTSFTWPSGSRKEGLCYRFDANYSVGKLLIWERSLTDFKAESHSESKCRIDQWRVVPGEQDRIHFKECFAVKQLTTNDGGKNNEVDAMTDLRFPHIAALLGTYIEYDRLHILTFPAGCCDLGDLLDCMSLALNGKKWVRPEKWPKEYAWPLEEHLEAQQARLKSYYICLCEALAYLHDSHVRHKDIKPENIIIDQSGRVVLMDFGISTKFRTKDPSLATQNPETPSTSRYRPPEMRDGDPRDQRSDVWSLGCVFLEMTSLILGKDVESCKQACSHKYKTGINIDFCANLAGIETWLNELADIANAKDLTGHCKEMNNVISKVKEMLKEGKDDRPLAKGLWEVFEFHDIPQCSDCHPRNPRRWKPTQEQQLKSEVGVAKRLKLQVQERNKELEGELKYYRNARNSIDHSDRTRSRSPPVQGDDRKRKEHDEALQRTAAKISNAGQIVDRSDRTRSSSSRLQGQIPGAESSEELSPTGSTQRKSRTLSQTSLPVRPSILTNPSDELGVPQQLSSTVTARPRGILTSRQHDQVSNLPSPPSPTPSAQFSLPAAKILRFENEGESEAENEDTFPGWTTVNLPTETSSAVLAHATQNPNTERLQFLKTPHIVEPVPPPNADPISRDRDAHIATQVSASPIANDPTRLSPDAVQRMVPTEIDRTRSPNAEILPRRETLSKQEWPGANGHISHPQRPRTPPRSICLVPDKQKVVAWNCHDLQSGLTQVEYKVLKGMNYVCFKIPHVDHFDVHSTKGFMASIDTSLHEGGFWGFFRRFLQPVTVRTIYMYNWGNGEDRRPVKLIDLAERKEIYPVAE